MTFQNMNSNANSVCLRVVNFPKLKIVRQSGLYNAFSSCWELEEANFPELMLLEDSALNGIF